MIFERVLLLLIYPMSPLNYAYIDACAKMPVKVVDEKRSEQIMNKSLALTEFAPAAVCLI
jgi:hypothetical protein